MFEFWSIGATNPGIFENKFKSSGFFFLPNALITGNQVN
jgi:hypothetical protein